MSWFTKLFGGKKEEAPEMPAEVQAMPTEEVSMPENHSEEMSEPVSEPQPTENVETQDDQPASSEVESSDEELER